MDPLIAYFARCDCSRSPPKVPVGAVLRSILLEDEAALRISQALLKKENRVLVESILHSARFSHLSQKMNSSQEVRKALIQILSSRSSTQYENSLIQALELSPQEIELVSLQHHWEIPDGTQLMNYPIHHRPSSLISFFPDMPAVFWSHITDARIALRHLAQYGILISAAATPDPSLHLSILQYEPAQKIYRAKIGNLPIYFLDSRIHVEMGDDLSSYNLVTPVYSERTKKSFLTGKPEYIGTLEIKINRRIELNSSGIPTHGISSRFVTEKGSSLVFEDGIFPLR